MGTGQAHPVAVLRNMGDLAADEPAWVKAGDSLTVEHDLAGLRRQQPGDSLGKLGLAVAVYPGDA